MKLEQDDNDEGFQLPVEILLEHSQRIFGLQKHGLSQENSIRES